MEVKLIHGLEIHCFKSRAFRVPANSTTYPHRLNFKLLVDKRKNLTKRFQGLAERWRLHKGMLSKGQDSTKQFSVHVVKKGETLTSISRIYDVPIQEIAEVNATILDIDLILEGQCLKIPVHVCKGSPMDYTWKSWVLRCKTQERCRNALNLFSSLEDRRMFTMLSSNQFVLVRRTGYFLILLPLVAFCLRCIMGAFHCRVDKTLKNQAVRELKAHSQGSRAMRWKSALSEMTEPEALHAEPRQDSAKYPEDQSQVPFEDPFHAYGKLEPTYQKFLSECGMNKYGYWRGGSPE